MKNLDADAIIEYMIRCWLIWIGFPTYMLVGAGTSYAGKYRNYLSNTFGCAILESLPESHYQIGRIERDLQSSKRSFTDIQEIPKRVDDRRAKLP